MTKWYEIFKRFKIISYIRVAFQNIYLQRLHIIIFFLSYTFICALTLNVEELKVDNAVAPEKILEKRQVSVLDAELITDIGGTRYTCPANYQLVGSQCHHVDCIYERTTTNIECLIPATPIYAGCGAGNCH